MLATSYPGFWLLPVLIIVLIGALPLGVFAIGARRRGIAIGCGAVYLAFGVWMVSLAVGEGGSDTLRTALFGGAFITLGLLLCLVRRAPRTPPGKKA